MYHSPTPLPRPATYSQPQTPNPRLLAARLLLGLLAFAVVGFDLVIVIQLATSKVALSPNEIVLITLLLAIAPVTLAAVWLSSHSARNHQPLHSHPLAPVRQLFPPFQALDMIEAIEPLQEYPQKD